MEIQHHTVCFHPVEKVLKIRSVTCCVLVDFFMNVKKLLLSKHVTYMVVTLCCGTFDWSSCHCQIFMVVYKCIC